MKKLRTLAMAGVVSIVVSILGACSTSGTKPTAPAAAPKAPAAPAATNIAGTWQLTVDSQMGPIAQKMLVTQTGKDIKGTLESQMGTVEYTGTVEGSNIKFGFNFNAQGQDLRIDYVGTTDGATMNGKAVFGSFGEGTFKGKKQ